MDLQSENNVLNIDNLILFNVGGLSTYEVSSLEKAIKNKQFNMNLIYGSNQIYNHDEYLKYIKDYFKGNSGIVKDIKINLNNDNNTYKNNNNNNSYDDNDSREALNYPHNTNSIDILNEGKQQKISIKNKNSHITNSNLNNIKTSSINNKDTMTYDGIPANSIINTQEQNIRNTLDSDELSDIK